MAEKPREPMRVETTVKNARRVEQRRGEICRAAVKLAQARGFGEVTTREIAAEAGLNIATMYQYVSCKEDIVFLICQQNVAEVRNESEDAHDDPVERLRRRFLGLIDAVDKRLHEVTFVYQESRTLTGEYLAEIKADDESLVDYFEEAIVDALGGDEAQVPARLSARHAVEMGYLWANKNWSLRKTMSKDEYAAHSWTMFVRALGL